MSTESLPRRPEPTYCCPEWKAFPRADKNWRSHVMHRFGHSRHTFTEDTVVMMAQVDSDTARQLIATAEADGWIELALAQKSIYVGRLPTTKRVDR